MTVKELNWFLGGYAFFIIRENVKALILKHWKCITSKKSEF